MTDSTSHLVRRCPGCDTLFSQERTAHRPMIYCTALCRKTNNTDVRYCPQCDLKFTLTATQPAATTFCSAGCKAASDEDLASTKVKTCMLRGCDEPTPIWTEHRMQPQFCTEEHAKLFEERITNHNPNDMICSNPGCTNKRTSGYQQLRRPQRYCSRDCRYAANPVRANHTAPTGPSKKATKAERKNLTINGITQAVYIITASKRPEWDMLSNRQRTAYERDGWTKTAWHTFDGPYSPAAVAHCTTTPDPALAHLSKEA